MNVPVATTPYPDDIVEQFTAAGWWRPESFSDDVARLSRERGGDPAYITEAGILTWRRYDELADMLATRLRSIGLDAGDFVGAFLEDSPLTHIAYLAIERAGLTIVGIGPRSGGREIRHLLSMTRAPALLTNASVRGADQREHFEELRAELPHLRAQVILDSGGDPAEISAEIVGGDPGATASRAPARGPNEVFMVNATSGTTGMPKCVQHSVNRWRRFARHAVAAGALGEETVCLSALPSPFGFGLWSAHFLPVELGAPAVLLASWDPDRALAMMAEHRVTVFAGVTTQLMMLLDRLESGAQAPPDLTVVFTGGEAVPFERARRFEELTGAVVLQFYGSNESGALSCTTVDDDVQHRLRTAGRVLPEMRVELVDPDTGEPLDDPALPGRPTCWGPLMTPGYLGDEAANAELFDERGRVRMPDLATIAPDGYLTVAGRVADIIIRGGMNISAADVEEALLAHPAVELAAVIGVPHPTFGEQVAAFVQLHRGASLTLADLQAHCAERGMAKHTWPEHLRVLASMPRNTGEKIAKAALRELL